MIVRWTIWYDDGTTFTSKDGSPEDAPLDGVFGIREWDSEGNTSRYIAREYYEWTGDGWRCGDQKDLERWLRKDRPNLKYGLWGQHGIWEKIRLAITIAKDF